MAVGNMLTAMDVFPTAADRIGVDQAAMQAAAFGDQLQEARYQNRLMHMANDQALREKNVADMVAAAFYQGGTSGQPQPAAPAAPAQPPMAPGSNMVAGPGAPTQPPVTAPTAPQQSTNPFDQQRVKLRDLYNSGRITAAEAQRYDEKITTNETAAREQQATAQLNTLKLAAEQNKVDKEKAAAVQEQMEPVIRAMTPILQKRDKLIAGGMDEKKADTTVQPDYEQMVQSLSQIPGFEKAASQAPKQFSAPMAYAYKDAYSALEKMKAASDARQDKKDERKATQFVTRGGRIISEDGFGNQYADGKPYHGPAYREKPGGGTPSAPTGPSDGAAASALGSGKGGVSLAVQTATEYMIYHGKMPPLGNGKEAGRVRTQVIANVGRMAQQLGISTYQLFSMSDDIKANVVSMTNLKKQMGVVEAAESQAQKNFNRLEQLYPTLGNGAVPMMNKVINAIKGGTGNPAPGTAAGVTYEAMMEYAKVISGQTTGAAVTDSAAAHAQELLDILKVNPAEFKAKLEQYRGMMGDRKSSLTGSYNDMLSHIATAIPTAGGGLAPRQPAGPQPGGNVKYITRLMTSDMRGRWNDRARLEQVYHNLRDKGYSQQEIEQAYSQAKGGR